MDKALRVTLTVAAVGVGVYIFIKLLPLLIGLLILWGVLYVMFHRSEEDKQADVIAEGIRRSRRSSTWPF